MDRWPSAEAVETQCQGPMPAKLNCGLILDSRPSFPHPLWLPITTFLALLPGFTEFLFAFHPSSIEVDCLLRICFSRFTRFHEDQFEQLQQLLSWN